MLPLQPDWLPVLEALATACVRRARPQAAVAELRRHFPLITDGENARRCVRAIAGWTRLSAPTKD